MNIARIRVENMNSPQSGHPVANQYVIGTEVGEYFQSYRSIIAFKANDGSITLDENYWDYSRTTGKYRNQFLGEMTADTRKKIKSGEYKMGNLN
jgi:hypothetical protein